MKDSRFNFGDVWHPGGTWSLEAEKQKVDGLIYETLYCYCLFMLLLFTLKLFSKFNNLHEKKRGCFKHKLRPLAGLSARHNMCGNESPLSKGHFQFKSV